MSEPIGVVGGGRMGAGIAHVFAVAGHPVTVVEASDAAQAAARERIATSLARAAERGVLPEPVGHVSSRVRVVGSVAELDAYSALVVEAVPEVLELKALVLSAIEQAVGSDCVVATNTSSLSIDALAATVGDPSRVIGMHFFNPVPPSALVEVVTGAATSEAVIARVVGWVGELGKTEIVVRDSPGFATSRLGVLLGLEAIRMLEEGVADAAAIDRAMELGYRHPMGPLRLGDLVGLDVRLHIAEHLASALGPRFEPPQLLRDKVARGELGRKTGQGFFKW
jgi:3-hydroxybutyryl-CoA dehydrogenase